MASGRMLSRKISANKDIPRLVKLVDERLGQPHGAFAALLFTWLIAHLDAEGRTNGDPDVVKGNVAPRLPWITSDDVSAYLLAAGELGLVIYYEAEGDSWLAFPGFDRNQPWLRKDREAASSIPSPDYGVRKVLPPDLLRSNSGVTPKVAPAELPPKVSEVKVSEDNRDPASPVPLGLELANQDKAAKAKKPESRELAEYFCEQWVKTRKPVDGKPPTLSDADRGQAKHLVSKHGLEACKRYVDQYLADGDAFLVKTAYALKNLTAKVDVYRSRASPTSAATGHAKAAPHNTESRIRDDF